MKAVASLLVSSMLLAPVANAQQSSTAAPSDRRIVLAQGQLPAIDRPVQAHETASTMRSNGHFFFDTEVNGTDLHMMFDTGARWVSLRAEDAEKAGINVSSLDYSLHMSTANGISFAAPVVIKVMKVGRITRTNVQAVVVKPGALAIDLLGQSFMSTMAGFSTEGDTLILRGN
ncbi:MAG TPA: TIGR02281 family clan AA aspartic protease [Acetobacteraceae bacterium]|jgi:aspartyl protease family protein|nr:TIGR02281 family clan AA aspartic protease [Acetobacteraceae bacterium]